MPCFFYFGGFVIGCIHKAIRDIVAGAGEYKTANIIM